MNNQELHNHLLMRNRYIYFFELEIGERFHVNGTPYKKKSSRTAWAIDTHPASGKWFYFGKNESVRRY